MTVGINPANRDVEEHPALQIRLVCVHARVIDVDEDIAARQAEIVAGGNRIGGHADARAAQVIGQHAAAGEFYFLHTGQAGDSRQQAG